MSAATSDDYDVPSAVTFFLIGLGAGSILALIFNPRPRVEAARFTNPRSRVEAARITGWPKVA